MTNRELARDADFFDFLADNEELLDLEDGPMEEWVEYLQALLQDIP